MSRPTIVGRKGYSGYNLESLELILKLYNDIQPLGARGWESLAVRYNAITRQTRTWKNLKKKFLGLKNTHEEKDGPIRTPRVIF